MIELLHPWVLIALFFIPLLLWLFNAKSSYLEGSMRISSSTLLEGYFRRKGERKYKIVLYLKILTLVLIIVAISRPRKIDQLQMMNVDVVDIILVIDISSSMLAEDFKPNRFIGFIKSDNSWHSVLPMELPDLVTRNCFQINVWECDEDE